MKPDPRIRLQSPEATAYQERVRVVRSELENSIAEHTWELIVAPLRDLAIAVIEARELPGITFPATGDNRLTDEFDSLKNCLVDARALHSETDLGVVLIRRLARSLAASLPAQVDVWTKAATLFKHCESWAKFLDSIPIDRVTNCRAELASSSSSSLDGAQEQRISALPLATVTDGKDPLQLLFEHHRAAQYISLSVARRVRSWLLSRISTADWIRWFETLPHPVFRLVALGEVQDPEFLENVLEGLANRPSDSSSHSLLLSAIWSTICLWEKIDDSISNAVRQEHGRSEDILHHWESVELPERASRLATILETAPSGMGIGSLFLRHLSPYRGFVDKELPSRRILLNELLNLFHRNGIRLECTELLDRPSARSLTQAGHLALLDASAEQADLVFDAYSEWLRSAEYVWYGHFSASDKEFLRSLANVLAKSVAPLVQADQLIQGIKVPSQGWKFDYTPWLRSLPKLSHALVVVALASVELSRLEVHRGEATRLMKLAWNEFHWMLEHGLSEPRSSGVGAPLAWIWACAGAVLTLSDAEITQATRHFGDPTLVVLAAKNLSSAGGLSDTARAAVEEEVNQLISFYRHTRFFSSDDERQLLDELRSLRTEQTVPRIGMHQDRLSP